MARDMASALNPDNEQTSKIAKSSTTSTSSQRKRRKRTTGNNGAADDCFTCASRKTKCDRRRPYCTQCLNLGRNCSGYKTTLTWGVGVASRGKLRGLSLPVNNDKKKDAVGDTAQDEQASRVAIDSSREEPGRLHGAVSVEKGALFGNYSNFHSIGDEALDTVHQDVSSTPFGHQFNYPIDPFPAQSRVESGYRSNLFGEETNLTAAPTLTRPISTSTHASHPYSEEIPGPPSNIQSNQSNYMPWSHVPDSTRVRSYRPDLPNTEYHDAQDEDDVEEIPHRAKVSHTEQFNSQYHNFGDRWTPAGVTPTLVTRMNLTQSIGQTPRLRYLIKYYAEVISPVIVAFDSSTNPYRTHILGLAQESKTLQHAIAALAASNLRQRKESNIISNPRTLPAQKSSMAHSAMTGNSLQAQFGVLGPGNDVKEESFHQRAAIQSLNAQLADPIRRREDSVLATLLILSLFHVCDSGVASFQTQFAGVKKLLSLRGTGLGTTSEESRWYTKMFTFLDVLTATTNDREGQLQGVYLDLATAPGDPWPLENLVGCDGRLFKVISRLNHLNVLSQNKPSTEYPITDSSIPYVPLPPAMAHFASQPHDSQYIPDSSSYNSTTSIPTDPDSRMEFWKEWRSIRQSLESWSLSAVSSPFGSTSPTLDPNSSSSSPSPSYSSSTYVTPITPPCSPISSAQVAPDNIPDLANISEAFRYSAILYTERLAHPHLPTSHARIQSLVLTCLRYISAVRSDVYLLWPLFVTGTECVFESQRAVIRERCQSLQKDSGFSNNLSCLGLLEKIWAKSDGAENTDPYTVDRYGNIEETAISASKALVPGGQAFRWRSVMEEEGLEGEYIVV